jgi:hypothetical protein
MGQFYDNPRTEFKPFSGQLTFSQLLLTIPRNDLLGFDLKPYYDLCLTFGQHNALQAIERQWCERAGIPFEQLEWIDPIYRGGYSDE